MDFGISTFLIHANSKYFICFWSRVKTPKGKCRDDMSMCLVNHLDLEPWSWAGFLVVVSLPSDGLCLPSPRPSTPPSRVRFPVWWWRARGRLPMWSQAWWSWRTPWPPPLSRKSWCASYPALCPGCMRRKSRAGSNGWALGETLENSEKGSQVHGKGEHLACLPPPAAVAVLHFLGDFETMPWPKPISWWKWKLPQVQWLAEPPYLIRGIMWVYTQVCLFAKLAISLFF